MSGESGSAWTNPRPLYDRAATGEQASAPAHPSRDGACPDARTLPAFARVRIEVISCAAMIPRLKSSARRLAYVALACAAIALASPALATAPAPAPPGYFVREDESGWLYRPDGEGDAALVIRVLPREPLAGRPDAHLAGWIAAHPVAGKPPRTRLDADGLGLALRETTFGRRPCRELLAAVPTRDGHVHVMVVTLPRDREKFRQRQVDAGNAIAEALMGREAGAIADAPAAPGDDDAPARTAPGDDDPPARRAPSPGAAHDAATPAPREPNAPAPRDARTASAVSSDAFDHEALIETVGFDTRARMGAGGMVMAVPVPIVLFRSGEAVDDIEALAHPGGLAAHRAKNPDDWGRWRRAGGGIEMTRKGAWKRLAFTKTLDRLPAGFRLEGRYRSMSGAGTAAIGGTSSVVVWSDLTFDRAGGFATGGGAGASSESPDGGARTTTGSTRAAQRGRYDLAGYTLTLRYDDGRVERRLIVADPTDAKTIWLDGEGWVRRPR